MKDVGIVGLPYAGKTTLFTALTSAGAQGKGNQAVVDVPDPRLDVLAEMEHSKKVVPAKVRFVDVPGGLSSHGLAELRQTDALCIVLGAFGPAAAPERDLREVEGELVLADLAIVENGLAKATKKARGSAEGRAEADVLEAARAALDAEKLLRDATLDAAAVKMLRGFGLLTLKPWVVVANVPEDGGAAAPDDALRVNAALEAEVAGMDDAEAAELLAGFGIKQRGLDAVIAGCYRALDLITFLTTGEDETRAWEVRRGARAPEAAGAIHSDLERGFIRAEVVSYEDLVAAGSWAAARAKGSLRVEGKDYEVAEGDVLHVRFAV